MALKLDSSVRVEGLAELDRALGELPKATARNVLRRVLRKAGEPIAEAARQNVPVDTGQLRDSIAVSTKIKNRAGKAEFAAAMKAGLGKDAAVSALRAARRAAGSDAGSFADMYVGPGQIPHAHLVEFGSVHNAPQPYMRPAWAANKDRALEIIKTDLWGEIKKAAERLAKKLARADAKAMKSMVD